MRYLSLFSGIEAASVAWLPLGWECIGVAEIEPFPCKVLAHHYPGVPNLGSVTEITEAQIKALGHIDLIVGGFPCQDLSIAGKRKGLRHEDGSATRSGLFFTAMRIIEWANPRWVLIENVPGLFSSRNGEDFASVVGEMAGCEFGVPRNGWENAGVAIGKLGLVEWVTLDAQFCRTPKHPRAVPQRRRRVFIVRDSGDWQSREPLFLITESLRGDPPPSRKAGEKVAPTVSSGAPFSRTGNDRVEAEAMVVAMIPACMSTGQAGAEIGVGTTLNCNHEAPIAFMQTIALAGNTIGRKPENGGNGIGYDDTGSSYTLTKTDVHAVAFAQNTRDEVREMKVVGALAAQPGMKQTSYIRTGMKVRRLLPIECEKLQGFPPGYTNIHGASDTPRYKALGNSMAVNVMALIGQRLQMVNEIPKMKVAS